MVTDSLDRVEPLRTIAKSILVVGSNLANPNAWSKCDSPVAPELEFINDVSDAAKRFENRKILKLQL